MASTSAFSHRIELDDDGGETVWAELDKLTSWDLEIRTGGTRIGFSAKSRAFRESTQRLRWLALFL